MVCKLHFFAEVDRKRLGGGGSIGNWMWPLDTNEDTFGNNRLEHTMVDPLITSYIQDVGDVDTKNAIVPYASGNTTFFEKKLRLIQSTAEDLGGLLAPSQFDLIFMTNVIEHCMDAIKVYNNIWKLLKPGGVLVFQEHHYHGYQVDPGHPIKVSKLLNDKFAANFEPIFRREFDHDPTTEYGHTAGIYFIGRKSTAAKKNR